MAFVSMIDLIYPVGSLYLSTSSTSPATLFGGTWTAISDANIAAQGGSYRTNNSYNGNDLIEKYNLPPHSHALYLEGYTWHTANAGWTFSNSIYNYKTDSYACGFVDSGDGNESFYDNSPRGVQLNFVPRNFGCYVWYRTA